MSTKKIIREVVLIFEKLQVQIEAVETGRNHYKFWVNKNGHKRMFVRACSPSDHRAKINFEGDIKRWVRTFEPKTGETNGYKCN